MVEEAIDVFDDVTPVCGWKLGRRSMRFLKPSAYYGVSLSVGWGHSLPIGELCKRI